MIEQDTVRLLRECDAGIKMGLSSIDEVLDTVRDDRMRQILTKSKNDHELLGTEVQNQLNRFHDEGKAPSPIAKGMSWMKTNVKMSMEPSDRTVADLMTDGCDMGVKSLSKYLNQYKAADERSKDITKRLIAVEEMLGESMRGYL